MAAHAWSGDQLHMQSHLLPIKYTGSQASTTNWAYQVFIVSTIKVHNVSYPYHKLKCCLLRLCRLDMCVLSYVSTWLEPVVLVFTKWSWSVTNEPLLGKVLSRIGQRSSRGGSEGKHRTLCHTTHLVQLQLGVCTSEVSCAGDMLQLLSSLRHPLLLTKMPIKFIN